MSWIMQVKSMAQKMLGNTLVTKQTGEQGKPCNAVLVVERFCGSH
jgi:succinyl-CoA synthetase beta subunit